MAGIVASTLRRKAFHRGARGSDQAKFVAMATSAAAQSCETVASGSVPAGSGTGPPAAGHAASYSPSAGGSRPSSRSSSFAFRSAELDDVQLQVRAGAAGSVHQGHGGIQVTINYLRFSDDAIKHYSIIRRRRRPSCRRRRRRHATRGGARHRSQTREHEKVGGGEVRIVAPTLYISGRLRVRSGLPWIARTCWQFGTMTW
jgi:hypothetical protein